MFLYLNYLFVFFEINNDVEKYIDRYICNIYEGLKWCFWEWINLWISRFIC